MATLNPATVHWLPSALESSGGPISALAKFPYLGPGNTYFYANPSADFPVYAPLTTGVLSGGTDPEFVVTDDGEVIMAEVS